MRIPLPIILFDDDIPEPIENFRFVFSRKVGSTNLRLGRQQTTINIEDRDGKCMLCCNIQYHHALALIAVNVGFDQTLYTVVEGSAVNVCVNLISPEKIRADAMVILTISSGAGTATG